MMDKNGPETRRVPYPGTEGAPTDSPHDMSHMVQIDTLILELKETSERWGNTCVYIRRGGMGWGAVALNRRDDDKVHGVFDLRADGHVANRTADSGLQGVDVRQCLV